MQHATRAARDAARVLIAARKVATTNQAERARWLAALPMLWCIVPTNRRPSRTRRVSDPTLRHASSSTPNSFRCRSFTPAQPSRSAMPTSRFGTAPWTGAGCRRVASSDLRLFVTFSQICGLQTIMRGRPETVHFFDPYAQIKRARSEIDGTSSFFQLAMRPRVEYGRGDQNI